MFNFVFFNDPKMESFQSQLRITDHHWCTQGTTNTRTFKMAGLLIFTTLHPNPDYNYGRAENDTGNHFQQKISQTRLTTAHHRRSSHLQWILTSNYEDPRIGQWQNGTPLINGNERTTETDATEWRRKVRQMKNLLHHTSIFQCKFWNK